jgi:hypothetical protein
MARDNGVELPQILRSASSCCYVNGVDGMRSQCGVQLLSSDDLMLFLFDSDDVVAIIVGDGFIKL